MNISKLENKHKGSTIYIVGTGPSMRVFPVELLKNKVCIGLNQAYKYFNNLAYSITIHPYLIPLDHETWNTKWITKQKESDHSWHLHLKNYNTERFIYFSNSTDHTLLQRPWHSPMLCVTAGIQTGAMHLAAILGASCAVLVGVDCAILAGQHHGHDQHTEYHKINPKDVYLDYYYNTVKHREELKKHYNMEILSLTPFIGLNFIEKDFERLAIQKGLSPLPQPEDIENVPRTMPLVTNYI